MVHVKIFHSHLQWPTGTTKQLEDAKFAS